MIHDATNPLAIQSQEWLTRALISLLESKEYNNVTITEIAAKADLSRRTFYRAFDSKEDILVYYCNKLFKEFLGLLQQETEHSYTSVIYLYFQFWHNHKHFLQILQKNNLLTFLIAQYSVLFPKVFQLIKGNHSLSGNAEAFSYAMAYSAGGLLHMLLKWAEDGMVKTPAEIMGIIETIFPMGW